MGNATTVVEYLSSRTWYFALTSYNSGNVESERSNVTNKMSSSGGSRASAALQA